MRTIGFLSPRKENEHRLAILPADIGSLAHPEALHIEAGYGVAHAVADADYAATGANICARLDAYECDVICSPKLPPKDEFKLFRPGRTLFGWIHAVRGREITRALIEHKMTAIAWEEMFEGGRHCFWRNNELAGEAAVLHALTRLGTAPYECTAAIIGYGNCARGAARVLERLGCRIGVMYDEQTVRRLRADLPAHDIVVNTVMWDVFRTDHLIDRADLARMKPGSMIIDVSCDEAGAVETTRPTTIADPVYEVDGILHYAVDHTPSLLYRTATRSISPVVARFLDDLVEGKKNAVLQRATIIRDGEVLDDRITRFQKLKSC